LLARPGKLLASDEACATATHVAVSVLAEGQEDGSHTCASYTGDRFAKIAHRLNQEGVPLIEGAIAQFSCKTHQTIDAGDHCLLIGQVTELTHREGRGLGYVHGRYFSLGLERGVQGSDGLQVTCGAIIETPGHVWLERTPDGFRPPQITSSNRASMRQTLTEGLAARGIAAKLGAVYSVFDTLRTRSAYILAQASPPDQSDLEAVPLNELSGLSYTTKPISEMMERFAVEAQNRDFSLYLGDASHGETHAPAERI